MIVEALTDPLNAKFVMVSETCVPLYHPALIWAQLMAEGPLSRVGDEPVESQRWTAVMETPHFTRSHFRKSSQWVTLSRAHAEIVGLDQHVYSQFRMYCRTQKLCIPSPAGTGHICIADESYVPSVLAAYGQMDATDRIGHSTYTDWSGGWHPTTFYPPLTGETIRKVRTYDTLGRCAALLLSSCT
jgi:hypothetical protein